jgi:hypothetical protein
VSRETTLARDAEYAWRQHRAGCAMCAAAARARQWARLCDQGAAVRDTWRAAASEAEQARLADAQPIPGQGTLLLWPEPRTAPGWPATR